MTKSQAIDMTTSVLGLVGTLGQAALWLRAGAILLAGAAAGAAFYFFTKIF